MPEVRTGRRLVALPVLADPGSSLAREFYDRSAEEVASDLLGAFVSSRTSGVHCMAQIVETEAYPGPHDDASHAAARVGRTARNGSMFGPPGTAYVYRIYGMHWCMNVVTGEEGFPAAVLLRAACPVLGVDAMRARRPGRRDAELLRGPGNLCRALAVDGRLDGHRLDRPPLRILAGASASAADIRRGPRVGISRAAHLPLRFSLEGCEYVSRPTGKSASGSRSPWN